MKLLNLYWLLLWSKNHKSSVPQMWYISIATARKYIKVEKMFIPELSEAARLISALVWPMISDLNGYLILLFILLVWFHLEGRGRCYWSCLTPWERESNKTRVTISHTFIWNNWGFYWLITISASQCITIFSILLEKYNWPFASLLDVMLCIQHGANF